MFNSFVQTKLMHCISEKKIIILFLFISFSCEEGVLAISVDSLWAGPAQFHD